MTERTCYISENSRLGLNIYFIAVLSENLMRNVHSQKLTWCQFTSQFYSSDDYYIRTEDGLEMFKTMKDF